LATRGTAATPGILILLGGAALLYWALFDKNGVINKFAVPPPVFADSPTDTNPTGSPPPSGNNPHKGGDAVARFNTGAAPPSVEIGTATYAQQKAAFMAAIAGQEGGYNSINPKSGAIGKYQVLPAVWRSWARKYLGDPNAAPTPANQELVVGKRMDDYYNNFNNKRATGAIDPSIGTWTYIAVAWSRGSRMANKPSWKDWNRHGYIYATNAIWQMAANLGHATTP
jgi:hypothetical protein